MVPDRGNIVIQPSLPNTFREGIKDVRILAFSWWNMTLLQFARSGRCLLIVAFIFISIKLICIQSVDCDITIQTFLQLYGTGHKTCPGVAKSDDLLRRSTRGVLIATPKRDFTGRAKTYDLSGIRTQTPVRGRRMNWPPCSSGVIFQARIEKFYIYLIENDKSVWQCSCTSFRILPKYINSLNQFIIK